MNMPSERLQALLVAFKGLDSEKRNMTTIEETCLALRELYGEHIGFKSALEHLIAAYEELIADSRFRINREDAIRSLVEAPIIGLSSIDLYGPPRGLETVYDVGQFYGAIANHIRSAIKTSNWGWCREYCLAQIQTT
jgi:hypothetical protein